MTSKIEQLRTEGNKRYSLKKFNEAIEIYKEAIELVKDDATFPSNMSACCFELGQYDRSMELSKQVIEMIRLGGGDDPKQLRKKNLARIVQKKIYRLTSQFTEEDLKDKSFDFEKIKNQLVENNNIKEEDWKNRKDQVIDVLKLPTILPSRVSNVFEYYVVGHDFAKSAIYPNKDGEEEEPVDETLMIGRIKEIEEDRIFLDKHPQLSYFYGGVGDCRHPIFTLADLNRQLGGNGIPPPNCKIHFTLNDIVSSALARATIVYLLLEEVGRFDTIEQLYSNPTAANAAALLYYVYIGTAIPTPLHSMLVQRLKQLVKLGDSGQLPEWLSIDKKISWPKIRDALVYWCQEMPASLANIIPISNRDASMDDIDTGNETVTNLPHGLTSLSLPKKNLQLEEQVKKALMDPAMLEQFGITNEQQKNEMLDMLMNSGLIGDASAAAESQRTLLQLVHETQWFFVLGNLPFPRVAADYGNELSLEMAIKCQDILHTIAKRTKEDSELVQKFNVTIRDEENPHFKINPTFFDVEFGKTGAETSSLEFKALDVVASFYRYQWIGLPSTTTTTNKNTLSSFDYFIHVFYQAARGFNLLACNNSLMIEMCGGDYQSVLDNVRDNKEKRKESGMAVEYDGIYLSNVPDYTGYLGRLLRVGYPAHWISGMIELLLGGSLFAPEPPKNKRVIPSEKNPTTKKMSITPWLIEIRTQAALWLDKYQIRLLDYKLPSVVSVKKYNFTVAPYDLLNLPKLHCESGSVFTNVLMVAIEFPPYQVHIPRAMDKINDNFRLSLLHPGYNKIVIVTSILFNSTTNVLSFWMAESDYNHLKAQNATLSIFRSDNWKTLTPINKL
ncbi:hypothetical protein DFA_07016 [Cavenderia fasciculata]|uniref:DUF4470 domain-containing protein n=1 Tax=Cavenderia fasciculata TaxID=261658 RepID=F4PXA8_CACFS|nr:uncharacterized protein DFA_07016 [Cavenderia fasciculata]EGG19911.1 hypothetical protein DFA_07016 [Cavenderia fasciculata]|eukprot:XP_004366894.1 hypothetical protein DFA_07016 [Cavenderia fasciculata]